MICWGRKTLVAQVFEFVMSRFAPSQSVQGGRFWLFCLISPTGVLSSHSVRTHLRYINRLKTPPLHMRNVPALMLSNQDSTFDLCWGRWGGTGGRVALKVKGRGLWTLNVTVSKTEIWSLGCSLCVCIYWEGQWGSHFFFQFTIWAVLSYRDGLNWLHEPGTPPAYM